MGGGSLTSYVGWIGWMDLTASRHQIHHTASI